MEPFSFKARDGLTVHGYATFPPDGGRSGLPTVLNVHGGPQARDAWGWDPEAQWLANRGLPVPSGELPRLDRLRQIVRRRPATASGAPRCTTTCWTRSSTRWIRAGRTRTRVAIYGGSYGGYAALVGAAFTPDVFRCAVDIVGPSNLQTLLDTIPPYWKPMAAAAVQAGRQPRDGQGVPVVALAAVPGS